MARKLSALRRKQTPSPKAATVRPARRGPMSLEPLTMIELRAIALARSSFCLPTMSMTKDWRAGMSKALIRPRKAARTKRCHATCPVNVRKARTNAWIMASIWVTRSKR